MPIRRVSTPRTETRPPAYLTREEARRLIDASSGPIKQMIAISLFTGIRQGELLRLKWEDFDLNKNTLMIRQSKTGEFRSVPFNPALKTYLKPPKMPSGELFPSFHSFPERLWRKTRREAKIKVKWHSLRHTFATLLILAGAPIRVVSELLGHKNISTTMIYSHLSEKHKEDAARLINF